MVLKDEEPDTDPRREREADFSLCRRACGGDWEKEVEAEEEEVGAEA